MQDPSLPAELPEALEHALRLVLYFDIFQHPLKIEELQFFLGINPAPVLACLSQQNKLQLHEPYILPAGRSPTLIQRRIQRSQNAASIWPTAHTAGALLARVPWVEGVLVTGALSKQSAESDGDIDFMLLVSPGRLWTVKSLLQGIRRFLPERGRELLCTNYLLSTDAMQIPEQSFYTAVELATAVPLYGRQACTRLLTSNLWAQRFIPGFSWSINRASMAPVHTRSSSPPGLLGARLEKSAQNSWDRFWNRKYSYLSDATRAQRFKRSSTVSTNHLHDFQGYVLQELSRRTQEVGIPAEPSDTLMRNRR